MATAPRNFNTTSHYIVTVGHSRVHVDCGDQREAIRLARQKLATEMPRLWDVIHQMDETRFRVESDAIEGE